MLFSSYTFIFFFLPLALLGYFSARRALGKEWGLTFLALASLVFYGWWNLPATAVLIGSLGVNFLIARWIHDLRTGGSGRAAFRVLVLGVGANIGTLVYFKYTNFLIDITGAAVGTSYQHLDVVMPLGISFFTFLQIAYLVDTHAGQAKELGLRRYLFFVTFFPKLIAGPMVRSSEWAPQLDEPGHDWRHALAIGVTVFTLGLCQKVLLADGIGTYADAVHAAAASGGAIGFGDAWFGALAYALQLFFDFAGYSDMAIGLAFMFGFRLPINFDAPFRATSIIDFWRRFHMTMSRFFMTYVFSPIALRLTRVGVARSFGPRAKFTLAVLLPSLFTFTLMGIWHGAGWGFVIFGLIQGAAFAINSTWRRMRLFALPAWAGWAATMLVCVISWVFFRAPSLEAAGAILRGMVDVGAPSALLSTQTMALWICGLFAVAIVAPSSQEIMQRFPAALDAVTASARRQPFQWRPSIASAVLLAALFVTAALAIGNETNFIYYKF